MNAYENGVYVNERFVLTISISTRFMYAIIAILRLD